LIHYERKKTTSNNQMAKTAGEKDLNYMTTEEKENKRGHHEKAPILGRWNCQLIVRSRLEQIREP
jgi:hypothetical protein